VTRRANDQTQGPGLWSAFEAEQLELEAYVTARLGGAPVPVGPATDAPAEPEWIVDALAASWAWLLPEVDAVPA
jgi:hypothetical protein